LVDFGWFASIFSHFASVNASVPSPILFRVKSTVTSSNLLF
jgi:hypothetical protein